jgi:hypothetical protein
VEDHSESLVGRLPRSSAVGCIRAPHFRIGGRDPLSGTRNLEIVATNPVLDALTALADGADGNAIPAGQLRERHDVPAIAEPGRERTGHCPHPSIDGGLVDGRCGGNGFPRRIESYALRSRRAVAGHRQAPYCHEHKRLGVLNLLSAPCSEKVSNESLVGDVCRSGSAPCESPQVFILCLLTIHSLSESLDPLTAMLVERRCSLSLSLSLSLVAIPHPAHSFRLARRNRADGVLEC